MSYPAAIEPSPVCGAPFGRMRTCGPVEPLGEQLTATREADTGGCTLGVVDAGAAPGTLDWAGLRGSGPGAVDELLGAVVEVLGRWDGTGAHTTVNSAVAVPLAYGVGPPLQVKLAV